MKKLISLLIIAIGLTTSMFAINFTVGGNLNAGGTFSDDSRYHGFSAGTGLLFNVDFYMGLGLQGELNVSEEYISIDSNSITFDERYEIIDMPFMIWWNGKFGFIGLGAGAGLNLSGTNSDFANNTVTFGFAAGANVIFYIGNHFGIVVGAHGVIDFTSQLSVEKVSKYDDKLNTYTFNTEDWRRRSIYGSVGVEYRF